MPLGGSSQFKVNGLKRITDDGRAILEADDSQLRSRVESVMRLGQRKASQYS